MTVPGPGRVGSTVEDVPMGKKRDLSPPAEPNARRSDSVMIVESIIAAAAELGPEAPVQAVAERAGVGIASLYRYFPTKDAIAAELGRRSFEATLDALRHALARAETVDEAIGACCQIGIDPEGDLAARRYINSQLPVTWLGKAPEQMTRQLVELIAHASARWVDQPLEERRLRAHTALSMVRGVTLMRLWFPEQAPPIEQAMPIIERALAVAFGIEASAAGVPSGSGDT